ncbi:AfsR/SARP family transcriptional regulator, partial [Kineococcus sp. SYSU DK003]|uniref:AfsR/SARP family transcriptional regulator n=1 Tax=Kineococcus sp. SYSU DK003 TaxID=3383124 RepID=UPI003D7E828C
MTVRIGLLGPVLAWRGDVEVDLRGPRHRAVLARLAVARGRVVPLAVLVDDLWTAPPAGAVAAVRTFVAALRRALEPDRAPRTPARVLRTAGAGYVLDLPAGALDVEQFRRPGPDAGVVDLENALALWRGPALDGLGDEPWLTAERARLHEERLHTVELLGAARIRCGTPELAVADLRRHTEENPWREEGWRLLGAALAACGRRAEALTVLREARRLLATELGLDAGPALARTEQRVLAAPAPARWHVTVDALRHLAVSGGDGLEAARAGRTSTLDAADGLDPRAAARVVGGFDVPALWSRADDPEQAARIVATAERLLSAPGPDVSRARLLATVGIELRGVRGARGPAAAAEAERLARELVDPAVLVQALNARYLASFQRLGATAEREGIGEELVAVSARHDLVPHGILGHLVLVQTRCAGGGGG